LSELTGQKSERKMNYNLYLSGEFFFR